MKNEKQEFSVIPVKSAFKLKTADSFEETTSSSRSKNSREKFRKVNGKTLVDFSFEGSILSLQLSNNYYIVVSSGKSSIVSEVTHECPKMESIPNNKEYYFLLNDKYKFRSKTLDILKYLCGRQVAFSESEQFLFIFGKGTPEYMVSSYLAVSDDNYVYLNISET